METWLKVGLIGLLAIGAIAFGVKKYLHYVNSDADGNTYQ